MAEVDFLSSTWELKEKIQKKGNLGPNISLLIEKNFDLPLSQIAAISQNTTDQEIIYFCCCLIIHRIREESPLGLQIISYFPCFNYLCDSNPPYRQSLISSFSSILVREIHEIASFDDFLTLAESINSITSVSEFASIPAALFINSMKFLWENINTTISPESSDAAILFLKRFKRAQDARIEVSSMLDVVINNICKYIENANDLEGIQESLGQGPANKNIEQAKKIISCVKAIKIDNEEVKKRIEAIENYIGKCIPEEEDFEDEKSYRARIPLDLHNPHQLKSFINMQFKEVIFGNQTERFNVTVWKAEHPQLGIIAVKEYTARVDANDLNKCLSEIDILEKLSGLAGQNNCFLKFYGNWVNANKLYIVMEYHEHNLMSVITHYKTNNVKIPEETLKILTIKLLHSFALMECIGIYHRDIKPHNILVTSSFDLKIIDFSIAEVKSVIDTTLITSSIMIQGSKGYMSPELQAALDAGNKTAHINIAKADVFSLGLTLLQIILMEDLAIYNKAENNQALMQKIELVETAWVKNVLKKMLCLDYHKRLSFRRLIKEIPGFETVVN
ncbi:hypothetical protein SteCoe_26263 [Stentor coeruleus]|uniref:Protein kinase domain-containing protein n=1 Tax=Stentor coeruleus TaxID=5963 RepID=A0A1R2BDB5_9CILI|nr:hypothetical protein SteCoe_26263 [Stentor coeruleus]